MSVAAPLSGSGPSIRAMGPTVHKVAQAAHRLVQRREILEEDSEALIEEAERSTVGRRDWTRRQDETPSVPRTEGATRAPSGAPEAES